MENVKVNLGPCHKEVEQQAGVALLVTYHLSKGRNVTRQVCGRNEKGELESYFQTIDHANLIVKVTNQGRSAVRHLNATRLSIYKDGKRFDDHLPDGNLLFEIVPDDRYFGDLAPGQSVTKEIALITRGTAPGDYEVGIEFAYALEGCSTVTRLPVRVCPD